MRHIQSRIDEPAAYESFRRRRRGCLAGLLSWRRERTSVSPRLPRLELVWLPYYLICFRGQSPAGEQTLTVSVQGHCGAFAVFQMHELLVEGDPPGPFFPPQMSESAAVLVGRKELVGTLLRVRSVRGSFTPEEMLSTEIVQYPYWIYYFLRRRKSIDFKTLDAVTGELAASKLKSAVLSAFCATSEARS